MSDWYYICWKNRLNEVKKLLVTSEKLPYYVEIFNMEDREMWIEDE